MPQRKAQAAALMASPDDTEAQFYEALQHGDLERLMAVWADEDDVACVHPGGPRAVGLGAIRASFEAVLSRGPVHAVPERVRRVTTPTTSVHNVLERVQVPGADGPQAAWVIATNVYLKTALGWRLVVHHASPGTANDVQDIIEAPSILH
jgi:ketosteroid isomerase-like protein